MLRLYGWLWRYCPDPVTPGWEQLIRWATNRLKSAYDDPRLRRIAAQAIGTEQANRR